MVSTARRETTQSYFTTIAHYANGTYWQEDGERLADFVVQIRFTQFFNEDGVSTAQQVTILFHFSQNTNAKAWSWNG